VTGNRADKRLEKLERENRVLRENVDALSRAQPLDPRRLSVTPAANVALGHARGIAGGFDPHRQALARQVATLLASNEALKEAHAQDQEALSLAREALARVSLENETARQRCKSLERQVRDLLEERDFVDEVICSCEHPRREHAGYAASDTLESCLRSECPCTCFRAKEKTS
jgi:hypothetical protein